jgi:hypothetical protein
MNKCLDNCTGIGEIQFMESLLAEIPKEERVDYVEQNAQKLRETYCETYCPVAKFRRKYGK